MSEKTVLIEKLLVQCAEDRETREQPRGSNRGRRVEAMLRNTGLGGGYPWCAAGVATWGIEAMGKLWPVPPTADCDAILSWARRRGVLHKSAPARGDIFLVMRGENDAFHTGIVSAVLDADTVQTWEGNTNDGGGREGDAVHFRERSRRNLWYVRWADAIPEEESIPPVSASTFKVMVSPHGLFPRVITHDERPYAPVRALVAAILGISAEATAEIVEWSAASKLVSVAGNPVGGTFVQNSVSWGPVREIGDALGRMVSDEGLTVTIGSAT